jgi:aminopeptidase N
MWRRWIGVVVVAGCTALLGQDRQRTGRIDVEHYVIDAEVNPRTQTLTATAEVRFTALDDITSLNFELNNALSLARVVDGDGRAIAASRNSQDHSVRLTLPSPLARGTAGKLVFSYDGRLTGQEESPVFGIRFAAIHPTHAYLLYPARWFPVSGYTADRFTSEIRVTVPGGYSVVSGGSDSSKPAGDKVQFQCSFTQPSFPGSVAVMQGEPKTLTASGVTTRFYLRETASMTNAYADEIAKVMTYFTSTFGLPWKAGLTVVETDPEAVNGYSGPGVLFLSPRAIGKQVNTRLLANQISRQWWGILVSPTTRNHHWWMNGLARYSEFLYRESVEGPNTTEAEMRDVFVDALTIEDPPMGQAGRLEDYSPEYWALTSAKGAATMQMLRGVIDDDTFFRVLKAIPDQFKWRSMSTDDLQKLVEREAGVNLQYFFRQWVDSSGAPEFRLEYTVFRTQKGFRVVGKVSQDLDTFRMPVDLLIETEGNPEQKRIDVVGTSSEFAVETFGKPKMVILDPKFRLLRYDNRTRVAVAIRRGEQFAEVGEFTEALKEYQKALEVSRNSSLAHYRIAEVFFLQGNNQAAANEFRAALNGDLEPKWTEVWSHINLGKIFDITDQRQRALNEYRQALRTKDNTQGALEEAQKYINEPYKRTSTYN